MTQNSDSPQKTDVDASRSTLCSIVDHQLLGRFGWSARSYAILLAWQAGELSEIEASKLSGINVVENREHVQELILVAKNLAWRYRETGETLVDDLRRETSGRYPGRVDSD
jgi:hypothetical protein